MAAKRTTKKTAPTAKKVAKKAAKKAAPVAKKAMKKAAKKAVKKSKPAPTADEIAKAAYGIYRRRVELGLPGDASSDWLEAERSLS